jgi:hypothetical protein
MADSVRRIPHVRSSVRVEKVMDGLLFGGLETLCLRKSACRKGRRSMGGSTFEGLVDYGVSAESPNDPKLSDCGGRRSLCGKAAGAGLRVGAQAVTPGAVRCSAWFGVIGVGVKGESESGNRAMRCR